MTRRSAYRHGRLTHGPQPVVDAAVRATLDNDDGDRKGKVIVMKTASRIPAAILAGALVILSAAVLAGPALTAATTKHCLTAQLRLKVVSVQGATGHRYVDYAFKNAGTSSCTLRGYPAAVLRDKHAKAMVSSAAKVRQWSLSKIRTVTLSPGKRAFFSFEWTDAGFCTGSFVFYSVRISPPGNAAGLVWHAGKTGACNKSARMSAVRPKENPF